MIKTAGLLLITCLLKIKMNIYLEKQCCLHPSPVTNENIMQNTAILA